MISLNRISIARIAENGKSKMLAQNPQIHLNLDLNFHNNKAWIVKIMICCTTLWSRRELTDQIGCWWHKQLWQHSTVAQDFWVFSTTRKVSRFSWEWLWSLRYECELWMRVDGGKKIEIWIFLCALHHLIWL